MDELKLIAATNMMGGFDIPLSMTIDSLNFSNPK